TPSSMTRLVEAISNAMAAVKFAPLRNNDRASATAAYEHDEDAIPNPAAATRAGGRSSPISRITVARRATAWTTAERKKPRIRAQRIAQVIDPASDSACPMALMPACSHSMARPESALNYTPMGYLGRWWRPPGELLRSALCSSIRVAPANPWSL